MHSLRCNIVYNYTENMSCTVDSSLVYRNFIHYVEEVAQFCCVTRFL